MFSPDFGADGNNENRLTVLFCAPTNNTRSRHIVPERAEARAFIAEPRSKVLTLFYDTNPYDFFYEQRESLAIPYFAGSDSSVSLNPCLPSTECRRLDTRRGAQTPCSVALKHVCQKRLQIKRNDGDKKNSEIWRPTWSTGPPVKRARFEVGPFGKARLLLHRHINPCTDHI